MDYSSRTLEVSGHGMGHDQRAERLKHLIPFLGKFIQGRVQAEIEGGQPAEKAPKKPSKESASRVRDSFWTPVSENSLVFYQLTS